MNRKNIISIETSGNKFARQSSDSRPYWSPIWETIAQMVEFIHQADYVVETRDVSIALGISRNTTSHYLRALQKSGFPISASRLNDVQGAPLAWYVKSKEIYWLSKIKK
jgi:biotin operon repressor